ncbi:hypothetical protein [Alicyclobacillus fodiniaquatilis]|uniref:Ribbon-helix-helix CopG family protein n=1 Tax=Alicyclobacillus fodiniaquatilis TaxID=1661150 RepID=A0ABW4JD87_9BACL
MPRPEKPKSERRTGQIVVYVHEPVKEELQREADAKGISVSLLVRELLETHVSGDKHDDRRIVVAPDVVMAVVRQVIQEGFEINDKFAPKSKPLLDDDSSDSTYPQPGVHNPVDSIGDKSSANLSPKTSRPTSMGTKAEEQRGDDSRLNVAPKTTKRRGKGGEDNDFELGQR